MFWFKKEPFFKNLLKLWLIGNRTWCRPIRSVIILVRKQIGLPLRGRPILFITRMSTDRIVLTTINNDVQLEKTRTVHFALTKIVDSFWDDKQTLPWLLVSAIFITCLPPEIPQDMVFIPLISKRLHRWWVSWIHHFHTLRSWRYCVVVVWDLTAEPWEIPPRPYSLFFGTRLRRQNVNLPPTQYRQLRRLPFSLRPLCILFPPPLPAPQNYMNIVSNFSWVLQSSQEK